MNPMWVLLQVSSTIPSTVAELVENRELHLQSPKQHLAVAQNRMKVMADRKRTDLQFSVGDQVLLKLQPYTQSSVANRPFPKLAYKSLQEWAPLHISWICQLTVRYITFFMFHSSNHSLQTTLQCTQSFQLPLTSKSLLLLLKW